jgi:pimeloyl-ACP methyl ester carboxylesterase
VAAGHSRGGVVASKLVYQRGRDLAGLVLIGTSHPRDFSLAGTSLPVTRVFGTRDTIADVEKLEATRHNLPPGTRFVRIDGGNHSQFGQYGFQPGDWPATIDRAAQHRMTVEAIFSTLADALKNGDALQR